jgi:hypothetical protein
MPSHLNSLVFRQLLRGRPLTHRQCLRLLHSSPSPCSRNPIPITHTLNSHRSLFNWGSKRPPPLAKARFIDPGYTELSRLDELLRMSVRPLDSETVIRALQAFFPHKCRWKSPLTDSQIRVSLVALRYLASLGQDKEVGLDSLVKGLQSLRLRSGGAGTDETLELARLLYESVETRRDQLEVKNAEDPFETQVVLAYVQILCSCRRGHEARALLGTALQRNPQPFQQAQFWEPVLSTFIAEKDDGEMARTLKMMEEYGVPLGPDLQLLVLDAFARQGDFAAAQQWHGALVEKFPAETTAADSIFLDLCIKTQRLSDGEAAFRRLVHTQPDKATWDLILRWAAAKRKGVDEVERMMDVMVKRNKEAGIYDRPDVETINGLLGQANAMDDSYMAERFVALADKRSIALNGKTYALQMAYRLDVGDLAGAYKAFQATQSHEVDDDSDIPQIHRLIQKLCAHPEPDASQIEELLAALGERRAAYPAATISALTRFQLAQGSIRALIDLLHTYASSLSQAERESLIGIFQAFILDRTKSVKASWDAYCIVRELFPELSHSARTQIMIDYFARGRSDVAVHVFGHMRQAEVTSERPTTETYALCFQGVGHAGDERSFDLVHNMLKLDSAIEPDTKLRNAIMLAQIGCGFRSRALEVWDDIAFSREGPSYNSIAIALYAVETTRKRTNKGLEIWKRLENYGVQPNRQIYVAHIGALAGQGMLDDACQKIDAFETAVGEPLDADT